MKKPYIFIFLFSCIFSFQASAQVITPSLDPGLPVELAAATSWRFGSTWGLEGAFGDQQDEQEKTREIGKYKNSGYGGLVALQPSHVTGELYYRGGLAEYIPTYSVDQNNQLITKLKKVEGSLGHFQLAIRGNDRYSVGIGAEQHDLKLAEQQIKRRAYSGSFGLRFWDNFFAGGGLKQGQTKAENFDELKWQIYYSGLAMQLGDPTSSMLRLEGSFHTSAEEKVENEQGELYYHRKFQETRGNLDILMNGILFSALYKQRKIHSPQDDIEDADRQTLRYGLGFRTLGVSMMLYGQRSREHCGEEETKMDEIQFTFSYSYI